MPVGCAIQTAFTSFGGKTGLGKKGKDFKLLLCNAHVRGQVGIVIANVENVVHPLP